MNDLEAVAKIDAAKNVVYVYHGEAGACKCGCAGVYSSPASPVRIREKNRRQSNSPGHEVNQEVVNSVVDLFKSNAEDVQVMTGSKDTIFELDLGHRAYLVVTKFPSMKWVKSATKP